MIVRKDGMSAECNAQRWRDSECSSQRLVTPVDAGLPRTWETTCEKTSRTASAPSRAGRGPPADRYAEGRGATASLRTWRKLVSRPEYSMSRSRRAEFVESMQLAFLQIVENVAGTGYDLVEALLSVNDNVHVLIYT